MSNGDDTDEEEHEQDATDFSPAEDEKEDLAEDRRPSRNWGLEVGFDSFLAPSKRRNERTWNIA